jgi:hypothetical protein
LKHHSDNEADEYIPNSALTTNKRRARKPTKFNCFPKLPIELRYNIWSLALPDARVIEILWDSESNKYYTDAPQPTILRVNKESRGEALRFYEAWVVNVRKEPAVTPCQLTRSASAKEKQYEEEQSKQNTAILFGTYINFSTDTVYFSSHYLNDRRLDEYLNSFSRFILSKQISKLKLLAVQGERHYRSTNNTTLWLFVMVSCMIRFGPARKLLYVVDDDCCDSDGLTMHDRAFRVEEVKDESLDKTIGWLKSSFVKIMEVRDEVIPEPFRHMKIHLDMVPAQITRERARRKK